MNTRRWFAAVTALAAFGAAAYVSRPAAPVHAAEPAKGFAYQGVASCTASCHNKQVPLGAKGGEYATWLIHDPHGRAYQDLFNERSRRMTELLRAEQPADKNPLCLSCHATETSPARPDGRVAVQDGVGCESCHGPAEKWLEEHYQPAWKSISPQQQSALGFVPLRDLVLRAQGCVRCHVGRGDADVNHDLIAAGHPWLRFELGSYLANYPKHWSEQADKAGRKEFEARAWLVGQVVSAQAELALLAQRAAGKDRPWPEFAEYDCFACHHDLADAKWRRAPERAPGRPGALPWGDWYLSMLPLLERERPEGTAGLPLADLKALHERMRQPLPDRAAVARLAGKAADTLQQGVPGWGRARLDAAQVQRWLKALDDPGKEAPAGWDRAAQTYLALAALGQAEEDLQGKPNPERRQALQPLRAGLGFPLLFDSPRGYDPTKPRSQP